MKNNLNTYLKKKRMMKLKYLIIAILGKNKTEYLKKNNIFGLMGESVLFQPNKLPNEPKLVKIHNNVKIAADVTFYTHDVINSVFSKIDSVPYRTHGTCIEIFDNVFIGGHSIIVGNVNIGPNAIIAAGSVVTRDVEPGTIVGGNPAKVIGKFEQLHEKRKEQESNTEGYDPDERAESIWKEYYQKRRGK